MLQSSFLVGFVLLSASYFCDVSCEYREKCEICMPTEKCEMFGEMSKGDQERWIEEHSCDGPVEEDVGVLFGFAPVAKGDYICCLPTNVWGIENPSRPKPRDSSEEIEDYGDAHSDYEPDPYNNHGYGQDNLHQEQNSHLNREDGEDVAYEQSKLPRNRNKNRRPGVNRPGGNNQMRPQQRNQNLQQRNPNLMTNFNNPAYNGGNNYNPGFNNNQGYNNNPGHNNPGFNNNPYGNGNQNFNRQPNYNGFGPNAPNQRNNGQCSISSFPPATPSQCCGLDVAAERMGGGRFVNRQPNNQNRWTRSKNQRRSKRDTPESMGISLDNRIAGGKVTDLYQFPWTVLLKTTFTYADRQSTFNCGGSLISSRYVLTAAHCLNEEGGRVSKVDIYLAEYDKRTYPRDCVNSPEGRKCIDNILLQAEQLISHPSYDDERLQNDIALIRLSENVPYTEFTRPICLPPINIDNPEYSNLRLAVAGWGRNGSLISEVKQSTVVNLVPQRQCSSSYPELTKKHLCAAGRTGEDTCKGDSGGPLMMLYEGQYYVSGVVSGKRADAPCGTSVPSLYTNVFHFNNWINENIRN